MSPEPDWCYVDDCPASLCNGPHVEHQCGDDIVTLPRSGVSVADSTGFAKGELVAIGPARLRWPWWAMFPREEMPTYRIREVTSTTGVRLGRRRKRGWQ